MKNIIYGLIGLFLVLFEITISNKIKIMGVAPCFSLLYISYLAVFVERERTVFIAVFLGLWKDASAEAFLGIYALLFVISVLLAGRIQHRLYTEKISTPILIGGGVTFLYALMVWIASLGLGQGPDIFHGIRTLFILIFIHCIVGPVIYFPIKNMTYTIERQWR